MPQQYKCTKCKQRLEKWDFSEHQLRKKSGLCCRECAKKKEEERSTRVCALCGFRLDISEFSKYELRQKSESHCKGCEEYLQDIVDGILEVDYSSEDERLSENDYSIDHLKYYSKKDSSKKNCYCYENCDDGDCYYGERDTDEEKEYNQSYSYESGWPDY